MAKVNFVVENGLVVKGNITSNGGIDKLTTSSGSVNVSGAAAPIAGQVLTASGPTTASWASLTPFAYPSAGFVQSNGSAWLSSVGSTGTGNVVLASGATISALDLSVTNTITGNISGNAGTATNLFAAALLPNGTSATTQISSDNSTRLATTAFVQNNTVPIFNIRTYGAVQNGSTDDTASVQLAINAAVSAGGGIVYIPGSYGITLINGALKDTSNANSQLLLPNIDAGNATPISITLMGDYAPYAAPSTVRTVNPNVNGSILKGNLNVGTGGALIGGSGTSGGFTNVLVTLQNLVLRMPDNAVLTAVNLGNVVGARLTNIAIDTGTYSDTGTQPTTTTSYGIIMPQIGNGVECVLENVMCIGFYNGIKVSEHCVSVGDLEIWHAINALVVPSMNHASRLERLCTVWCQNHVIGITAASYLNIGQHDIEHAPGTAPAWMQTVYTVNDTNNYIYGYLEYHAVLGGTGVVTTYPKNGGTNLVCTELRGNPIGAAVTNTSTQSMPANASTAVTFATEYWDTDNIHDNVTNNTRMTCNTRGVYMITAGIRLANDTTGTLRQVQMNKNTTVAIGQSLLPPPVAALTTKLNLTCVVQLVPGDFIEVQIFHDATAAISTVYTDQLTPIFTMVRIG